MTRQGKKPFDAQCVNTDIAYDCWSLNIEDLERRRAKLVKLGVLGGQK